MLVADCAVSASDGALDVAEGGIDPFECGVQRGLAAVPGYDRLMDPAGVTYAGEAAHSVTDAGAGGIDIALPTGRECGTAAPRHAAQLHGEWIALRIGVDR